MKWFTVVLIALVMAVGSIGSSLAADQELVGAGATFPYPLYSKMFDVYSKEQGTKVNYQAIGSGGGIRQLVTKTVDFGGSDAVMGDEDTKSAGAPVLHIPICAGSVVLTYSLPGDPSIKLSPDIIADIFLGKIKKWDDPRISAQNQGIALPGMAITIVHRSDGSGTTNIFSDYLSKVSKEWKEKVGTGTALNWPVGLGAKGNPGVAGLVKQTPGSIGYVELIYALQNNMPYGTVQNRKGKFIKPSLSSTSAAANITLPDDMKVSLTDSDSPEGYPISGFTWIIVYKDQKYGDRTENKAKVLAELLRWMTTDGQKYAEPMQYAPLSKAAADKASRLIQSMTYGSAKLIK
jgi:phosphate transport system substrate-binding protein